MYISSCIFGRHFYLVKDLVAYNQTKFHHPSTFGWRNIEFWNWCLPCNSHWCKWPTTYFFFFFFFFFWGGGGGVYTLYFLPYNQCIRFCICVVPLHCHINLIWVYEIYWTNEMLCDWWRQMSAHDGLIQVRDSSFANLVIPSWLWSLKERWRHHMLHRTVHFSDVIMGTVASQITSLKIVYSTVYSDTDQRKH